MPGGGYALSGVFYYTCFHLAKIRLISFRAASAPSSGLSSPRMTLANILGKRSLSKTSMAGGVENPGKPRFLVQYNASFSASYLSEGTALASFARRTIRLGRVFWYMGKLQPWLFS